MAVLGRIPMSLPGRLLVVEQEEQVRGYCGWYRCDQVMKFRTAGTGEETIERMKASSGFDAVLSEAALPGMNGHELASHLAIGYPSTKVIFVTAINVECDRCPHAVQCQWIAKPFAPKELVKRIAEILGETPGHPIEEIRNAYGRFRASHAPGTEGNLALARMGREDCVRSSGPNPGARL